MRFYKVLSPDLTSRNGGTHQWHLGEWTPPVTSLEPCVSGYHVCQESDLVEWLGPVICEAEIGGQYVRAHNKTVATTARITRVLDTWNATTQRLFACDCAERVLALFEKAYPIDLRPRQAIETARSFARGEATRDSMDAAADALDWVLDRLWWVSVGLVVAVCLLVWSLK